MVVEAEITILFQIVLYLNLIYLIQQKIKWFHGFLLVDKQWGTIADTKRYIDFPLTLNTCFFGSIRTGSRFLQERGSWSDVTNNIPYRVTTSPPNSFSIYMEDAEVLVKVSYFLVGK